MKQSELILNPDGSIYHLNIKRENIANTILCVGDPDRVPKVSRYFDDVTFQSQKREIVVHTGSYNGKPISCISTGMGTDNIDIVMNELDALFNIDLETRTIRETHESFNIIRIGTSGSLQSHIPVDSFVLSTHGLGLDGLLYFYENSESIREIDIEQAFLSNVNWNVNKPKPYVVEVSEQLFQTLYSDKTFKGITATASGFYGPQARTLRIKPVDKDINEELASFEYNEHKITNFEMETSGLYGLAKIMGHHAISCNSIIANRATGTFSEHPNESVENMIQYVLSKVVDL